MSTRQRGQQFFNLVQWIVLLCGVLLHQAWAFAQESVCAEVKIVIEQKLSLERQAFDAHMVITNGLEASALQNVGVSLYYLDQNNQPVVATSDPNAAGASFFYRTDTIAGINAIDGSGSIAPKTKGDIHWLIIPAAGTGGTDPKGKLYYVGAKVTYTLNGKTSTVDVTPDYIVVRPQPLLKLDYFLPTDVYADDAFTPETEPSIPFTLGVRIKNVGAGTAYKTSIESAQPKIVENKQGLLISFEILNGYVSDLVAGKSLLLNFGDIAAGTAKVGRWNMMTTLSGKFVEFGATYTHADSLGGSVTSLIQDVTTHTLIHDVKVDLAGRDAIRDFLAKDGDTLRVYESDGVDTTVSDQSKNANLQNGGATYSFVFPATPGFVYASVPDPFGGQKPVGQVQRSDGKMIPAENVWLSKTRDTNLVWHYFVNIFDVDSTGSYNVGFSDNTGASLAGVVYNDKNGNGIRDTGEPGIPVVPVAITGQDGGGASVSAQAYTDAQGVFKFSGLNPGSYTVKVAPQDGLVDGAALVGTANGSAAPGTISNIMLGAGAKAEGYLFAKRTGSVAPSATADLSMALTANPVKLKQGDTVTFTLTASNLGPDNAGDAVVTAQLPAGLTEQATQASIGSYSAGSWNVGTLAKGQSATLTITAKAGALAGASTYTARIGSGATDPVLSNNAASVVLQPTSGGQITITQQVVQELRWLLLVSCLNAQSQEDATCAQSQATAASTYLQSKGYEANVVLNVSDFAKALRTGRPNAIWVHAGMNKLSATALEEVRAAVRRGNLLVLDGAPDANVETMADMLGTRPMATSLGNALNVTLVTGSANFSTTGGDWAFERTTALEEARYSVTKQTAIATSHYGQGNTMTLGFDALATLQDPSAEPTLWSYLQARFDGLTPTQPDPVLARSLVLVQTKLNSAQSDAASVQTIMTLPTDMLHEQSQPVPNTLNAQSLTWNSALPSNGAQTLKSYLRLPTATGTVTLQTQAKNTGDGSVVGAPTQTWNVLGADTLIPRIQGAVGTLVGQTQAENGLITQAQAAVSAAKAAYNQNDANTTIARLSEAEVALRVLSGTQAESVRQDIALWFALAGGLSNSSAGGTPVSLKVVSGSAQVTGVGQTFPQGLTVQVLDAQGAGVPNVAVTFTAPATGASAAFAGGLANVTVTTDADGNATASSVTANAVEGNYAITVTAKNVADTVRFELTNQKGTPKPAILKVMSGDGQSTQIGTPFAQALQLQVQDQNGVPLAGVPVTFTLPASGAGASFDSNGVTMTVVSDGAGIATSSTLTANNLVGSYMAVATASGLAQTATFSLTNGAVPVEVLTLSVISGTGQSAVVSTAFAAPLQVKVVNAQNQGKAGVLVRFTLPAAGASAQFAGGVSSVDVLTDANGVASSPVLTANGTAGSYAATATQGGQTVSFNLTNSAVPVEVLTLSAISGTGQSAVINTAFAAPLQVKVVNAQNQGKAGVLVRFTLPAAGASAQFAGGVSSVDVLTDANGVASSPVLTANGTAGSYAATATQGGQTATYQLINTSKTFSGTTATGTGTVTLTVSGGGATCALNPNATQLLPAPTSSKLLNKVLFPHGVLEYELIGCTPGSQVTITTQWPNLKGVSSYMKYGPTPLIGPNLSIWYVPNNLHISGNTVSYTVKDGGLGDDDLTANGVIRDPGGPVINEAVEEIPVAEGWLRGLLVLLLGIGAWVYLPKRSGALR